MEQRFLDAAKKAWDSADVAPEARPPSILTSDDSGPWPLPLYPVLGEFSCHRGDYDGKLLSTPCGQLPSGFQGYISLTEAQSTWEPSPAHGTPRLWPRTQKTPEAPAEETEPEEETAFLQPLPAAKLSDDRDGRQDTEPWDRAHEPERRGPPVTAWGRQHRVFSGCRQWIGRAVYTLRLLLSDLRSAVCRRPPPGTRRAAVCLWPQRRRWLRARAACGRAPSGVLSVPAARKRSRRRFSLSRACGSSLQRASGAAETRGF
ncbi:annexin-2 receptor-like [Rousettus aegyptiacus]|uniref:annexin-2 receptor-like n=1 Tax=Rousettus aegyptiacus TaxID=9407 RepID=UPI00168D047E|nr:annexin-2 receptor-like [Rousettus aegyptiacus]